MTSTAVQLAADFRTKTLMFTNALTDSWPLQEQYEKNMHGLVGSLFDTSDEEDIPLLYFHSFRSCFKWLCSWMIPGLGMFSEAYFIFSIGNIKPILQKEYPACWSKHVVRSNALIVGTMCC